MECLSCSYKSESLYPNNKSKSKSCSYIQYDRVLFLVAKILEYSQTSKKKETTSITLVVKLLEFFTLKEPTYIVQSVLQGRVLEFLLRNLANEFARDYLLKLLDPGDRFFDFNQYLQNHLWGKLEKLEFFYSLIMSACLGKKRMLKEEPNKRNSVGNIDNVTITTASYESKYKEIYQAAQDPLMYPYKSDFMKYDIDLLSWGKKLEGQNISYNSLEIVGSMLNIPQEINISGKDKLKTIGKSSNLFINLGPLEGDTPEHKPPIKRGKSKLNNGFSMSPDQIQMNLPSIDDSNANGSNEQYFTKASAFEEIINYNLTMLAPKFLEVIKENVGREIRELSEIMEAESRKQDPYKLALLNTSELDNQSIMSSSRRDNPQFIIKRNNSRVGRRKSIMNSRTGSRGSSNSRTFMIKRGKIDLKGRDSNSKLDTVSPSKFTRKEIFRKYTTHRKQHYEIKALAQTAEERLATISLFATLLSSYLSPKVVASQSWSVEGSFTLNSIDLSRSSSYLCPAPSLPGSYSVHYKQALRQMKQKNKAFVNDITEEELDSLALVKDALKNLAEWHANKAWEDIRRTVKGNAGNKTAMKEEEEGWGKRVVGQGEGIRALFNLFFLAFKYLSLANNPSVICIEILALIYKEASKENGLLRSYAEKLESIGKEFLPMFQYHIFNMCKLHFTRKTIKLQNYTLARCLTEEQQVQLELLMRMAIMSEATIQLIDSYCFQIIFLWMLQAM